MNTLFAETPWLAAMAILLVGSAFFSSSEAALFSLSAVDRRRMARGRPGERVASGLLAYPERLLMAVLFWNLLTNTAYFAISSIIAIRVQRAGEGAVAGLFVFVALMTLIVTSEMLPKSLAVLLPGGVARIVSFPLAAMVRLLDPVLPILRLANIVSQRLFFPQFKTDPYLHVSDLERAVRLSTSNATLIRREQTVLENIVSLSDIRAEELMRPRVRLRSLYPPIHARDIGRSIPQCGYLLVADPKTDQPTGVIALGGLAFVHETNLEHHAQPIAIVPWSASVAQVLTTLRERDYRVADVINEQGESIGIITLDDILDQIFTSAPSRTERVLRRQPIETIGPNRWRVSGMARLKRLIRDFEILDPPPSKSVTVAGVVQEMLERMPELGDTCRWGPFEFRVIELPNRGNMFVEMTLRQGADDANGGKPGTSSDSGQSEDGEVSS